MDAHMPPGVAALITAGNLPLDGAGHRSWADLAQDPANRVAIDSLAAKRSKSDVHILYARALRAAWSLEQALVAQSLLPASRISTRKRSPCPFLPSPASMTAVASAPKVVAVHPSCRSRSPVRDIVTRGDSPHPPVQPSGEGVAAADRLAPLSKVLPQARGLLCLLAFGGRLPGLVQKLVGISMCILVLCPGLAVHLCFAWVRSFWGSATNEVVDTMSASVASVVTPVSHTVNAWADAPPFPLWQTATMVCTFLVARLLPH